MSVNVISYPAVNEQCHNISWTTVCKVNLHLWSNDHCSDSNSRSRFKTVKMSKFEGAQSGIIWQAKSWGDYFQPV